MKVELTKDDIDSILGWYDVTENECGFDCMTEDEVELYNYLSKLSQE